MFPSTRHSLLQAASTQQRLGPDAMNALLEIYWQPCYRYVRLQFSRSHEEAEDLVQGFFTALLDRQMLSNYDSAKGPFRSYLRTCLDRFALKDYRDGTRQKRGGGKIVALTTQDPASKTDTPEEIFYREWQRNLFALAIEDLQRLCEEGGHQMRFAIFAAYDLAEVSRPSYEELAQTYSAPLTTITNSLAWARREIRRLIEQRLATVTPSEHERRREVRLLLS